MTQMGLNYLQYQEANRSNLEKERQGLMGLQEAQRHNIVGEGISHGELNVHQLSLDETIRSNQAREGEMHRSNVAKEQENYRANTAKEAENYRSNTARETESNRTNVENEKIRQEQNTQNSLSGLGNYARNVDQGRYDNPVSQLFDLGGRVLSNAGGISSLAGLVGLAG